MATLLCPSCGSPCASDEGPGTGIVCPECKAPFKVPGSPPLLPAEAREMFRRHMVVLKQVRGQVRWMGVQVFAAVLAALLVFGILFGGCLGPLALR